jgi:pyruvate dehydrogenase E2 component (dihydrolipoamide acetyltransferase)
MTARRSATPGGTSISAVAEGRLRVFGRRKRALSRIRKISGANLARNWVMIPHVTQFDEADITTSRRLRVALNKENEKAGIKVTMLAFLIKASSPR